MKFNKKQLSKIIYDKNKVFGAALIFVLVSITGLLFLGKSTYSIDESIDGISVACPLTVAKGDTIECNLTLNSVTMTTYGISGKYNVTEGMEFVEFVSDTWEITYSDEDGFVLVNLDGVSGTNSVGTVKYTVPTDAVDNSVYMIELTDVTIGDGEDTTLELENVSSEIIIQSDSNLDYSFEFSDGVTIDTENKYIKYLNIDTTVSEFLSQYFDTNGDAYLYDRAGNIKEDNIVIKTGDVLKVFLGDTLMEEYTLSVLGDSNGDGRLSVTDLAQFRKHLVNWKNPDTGETFEMTGVYKEAFDFNKDGRISVVDLAIMRKKLVGLI